VMLFQTTKADFFFPTSRTLEHRPGQLTFPTTTYPLTCFSSSLLSQCICAPLPLAPFDSFYTIFDYRPPGSDCRLEFSAHPSLLYSTETKSKTHPNLFSAFSAKKKASQKSRFSTPIYVTLFFNLLLFLFPVDTTLVMVSAGAKTEPAPKIEKKEGCAHGEAVLSDLLSPTSPSLPPHYFHPNEAETRNKESRADAAHFLFFHFT